MRLYQSFNGDEQRAHISPIAIPYDVKVNTGRNQREYELFQRIGAEHHESREPWGLVSWKFQLKSLVSPEEFYGFANSMFDAGCDCVFINPMIGNEAIFLNVWEQWIRINRNVTQICNKLKECRNANPFGPMGRAHFAFCNYFRGCRS